MGDKGRPEKKDWADEGDIGKADRPMPNPDGDLVVAFNEVSRERDDLIRENKRLTGQVEAEQAKRKALQEQLEDLNNRHTELRQVWEDKKAECRKVLAELQATQAANDAMGRRVQELQRANDALTRDLASLPAMRITKVGEHLSVDILR